MRWRSKLNRALLPFCSSDVPLKNFTTLGVGGVADCLAKPSTRRELSSILDFCNEEGLPVWFLGGGSNVLISDEGLRGMTILTEGLNGIFWEEKIDTVLLEAEAGVSLAALLALSIKRGWGGLEFVAGIPGSVGGSLRGNAGVEGKALGDLVESVLLMDGKGTPQWEKGKDIRFSYRYSDLQVERKAIVACRFSLTISGISEVALRSRSFFDKRMGQPKGLKTAGCIFKNPRAGFAGRILDEAGCKGLKVGAAEVSGRHANFIVNNGSASSRDIVRLISSCRDKVFEKTGIFLDLELCLMGEFLDREIGH